ncbi:MAG: GAF domain-containing sensor histidine kinase [Spirulina sp. SIO3F2]|nr:GAF domain-containing sensor histidine kinase [Spirulina sp. SIO3F2]
MMISAELPKNEEARLQTLYELDILDTLGEQAYDDLTQLAAEICQTPIALVSLVDRDRQWFKSKYGLAASETPRDLAFCAHTILNEKIMLVEDSSQDERFADNPLVTGQPHVRFYAGVPLLMSDNTNVGTLCVIAHEPRTLSVSQKAALQALARQVVSQLELRLKVKALKKLDQIKDEFTAMVSHELRTPLTSIYGSLSLLNNDAEKQVSSDQQQELLGIAYRNSERLLDLVNDILDLSRLESGKLVLHFSEFDLVALLEESIQLNQDYCKRFNVNVKLHCCHCAQPMVMVNADQQRLLQVISNLISNAAKFTHPQDVIDIGVDCEGERVKVSVTDHGPGIPIEKQNLLFARFQQIGSKANQKLPGTGLGLNISKKIIELHGGEIDFHSVPHFKTTFYFKLAIAQS